MNSLWLTENKNDSKFESLSKNINTDVCIIGAGIFGMTCGYYLSKAGLNVSIIEKNEIGHKTTGHTTAKITYQHGLFYLYISILNNNIIATLKNPPSDRKTL